MSGRWEDNRSSSRRYERSYDHRREGRRDRESQFYNNTNGLVIYIDTNCIGKLIGKGGSKIKALQNESNAMIKIDKQCAENGQTAVTLTGTDEAQQRAKSLIEELAKEKKEIDWANFEYENFLKQKCTDFIESL